ncbi:MAG TPA: response regulator [Gemmatimonadaceae bacterium]|nr:response regulator [Gemmatimonadaceae bacterium]HXV54303.1 response regulator [Gemmatimonadaceae bacterium]
MSSSTVLVCDDAVFMRTMVSDILSQAGFTVVGEAENGKQAVEKYQQLKPDLVTMDIIMPEMGGIEAVKKITQMDPGARILMCSAMGQQALVQEALQAGARDFVVKPFQPSRVLEAVQRVLA